MSIAPAQGRIEVALLLVLALLGGPARADQIAPHEKRSGYEFISRETRALQDDDATNPGMLWVLEGEALWNGRTGASGKSCADCHGKAETSMKGVAARYPAFDERSKRPVDLEQRINACRVERQQATAIPWEHQDLLALTAFVAMQSRGLSIALSADDRLRPFIAAGRHLFEQRQGQLNLSCSGCHDANWGRRLAGNVVPQAHPTGYPIYRLEWQSLGSLQRRLRNCMIGMRAEPYEVGSADSVNLELYLMWRAQGLAIETPAVRP